MHAVRSTLLVLLSLLILPPLHAQVSRGAAPAIGDVVTVATNPSPKLRDIGANYFDALHQSQVWMNVEPEPPQGEPAPVTLNVTVAFDGLRLSHPPATVQIRASSIDTAFPLRIRQPILRFVLNGTTPLDLTTETSSYRFVAGPQPAWGDAPADTIVTDLRFASLQQIAQAREVTVDALGFSVRLAPADLTAFRLFIHTLEDGVVVRPK